MEENDSAPIGVRRLTVQTSDGERGVIVAVFPPEPLGDKWICAYEIGWPEGMARSRAQGNDALHAMLLCQQKIGMELYMSRYHHERRMWWRKPWDGYGFPLPKEGRDLLIGDDARFYGN
ncbi:hypothetical protein EMQ25_14710 [Arsenicitalea aurantiaca]|uniref:DUF6968 domain-containing protein n=1 Tax=Arsenicitalea aurantiaca TaxID=1783274 RepID=A0A433X5P3_9HYPH|nr:hypothetical protein [Arsenicitalea aurantiaca]RUT29368.1 hypothetical protein EMQ25_14710 [Arsenicitalea aurantiaca]